jgi:hypothetical protein
MALLYKHLTVISSKARDGILLSCHRFCAYLVPAYCDSAQHSVCESPRLVVLRLPLDYHGMPVAGKMGFTSFWWHLASLVSES